MAILRRIFAFAVAALVMAAAVRAQTGEYKLKAAYLCRFVDFVDWPAGAFAAEDSPLVIGVLGPDPFGSALDAVVVGQTSRGHPLEIRRCHSVAEAAHCHVLFISVAESSKLEAIVRELNGAPILTVSDMENFTDRGGMIRFFTENNKIRFRINPEGAKACKLAISSRLLQLAEIAREKSAAP